MDATKEDEVKTCWVDNLLVCVVIGAEKYKEHHPQGGEPSEHLRALIQAVARARLAREAQKT